MKVSYSFYSVAVSTRDVHLMTQADTIHISMHSQRYDTLKIHMKQLPMRCDMIHPFLRCVRFQFRFDSIQHNAIRCNAENMITFNASRPLTALAPIDLLGYFRLGF